VEDDDDDEDDVDNDVDDTSKYGAITPLHRGRRGKGSLVKLRVQPNTTGRRRPRRTTTATARKEKDEKSDEGGAANTWEATATTKTEKT
jgi:hypothetical protein